MWARIWGVRNEETIRFFFLLFFMRVRARFFSAVGLGHRTTRGLIMVFKLMGSWLGYQSSEALLSLHACGLHPFPCKATRAMIEIGAWETALLATFTEPLAKVIGVARFGLIKTIHLQFLLNWLFHWVHDIKQISPVPHSKIIIIITKLYISTLCGDSSVVYISPFDLENWICRILKNGISMDEHSDNKI